MYLRYRVRVLVLVCRDNVKGLIDLQYYSTSTYNSRWQELNATNYVLYSYCTRTMLLCYKF